MEWVVESQVTEQRKLFAHIKNTFHRGMNKKFKGLEQLRFRKRLSDGWKVSIFNKTKKTEYFDLYVKVIEGKSVWIAVAKDSKRQYKLTVR